MSERTVYVAAQIPSTREWVPVARLSERNGLYVLLYTKGALRVPNFVGFGRMSELDEVYMSSNIFPFFANRIISRSRPDYKNHLKWLGLDALGDDPISILSVTGGIRQTDQFEIVAMPRLDNGLLTLDFFPKGLRYLDHLGLELLSKQTEGRKVFLLRDVQNDKDPNALLLRTENPICILGYVPRYYCAGLSRFLEGKFELDIEIRRLNEDAPVDMRVLCRLVARSDDRFSLFESEPDFEVLPQLDLQIP